MHVTFTTLQESCCAGTRSSTCASSHHAPLAYSVLMFLHRTGQLQDSGYSKATGTFTHAKERQKESGKDDACLSASTSLKGNSNSRYCGISAWHAGHLHCMAGSFEHPVRILTVGTNCTGPADLYPESHKLAVYAHPPYRQPAPYAHLPYRQQQTIPSQHHPTVLMTHCAVQNQPCRRVERLYIRTCAPSPFPVDVTHACGRVNCTYTSLACNSCRTRMTLAAAMFCAQNHTPYVHT